MIILFSVITVAANTYKSNSDHKQKLTRMMFPFLLHKEFLRVFGVIQNWNLILLSMIL